MNFSAQAILTAGVIAGTANLFAATLEDYLAVFRTDDPNPNETAEVRRAETDYLLQNIPRFECPDADIERTYYFRWWTFCKHIKRTTSGRVITEFSVDKQLKWAGKYNTICCAAGHHLMEARWLGDRGLTEEYVRFFYREGELNGPKAYVTWLAHALLESEKVTGNRALADGLLLEMVRNYEAWEKGWQMMPWPMPADGKAIYMGLHSNGLFATTDDREGSEYSVSGNGYRPLVNAAMCAEAAAISTIAARCGRTDVAAAFARRAEVLRRRMRELLWNPERGFYTTRSLSGESSCSRELFGYAPWYFGLADDVEGTAWRLLMRTDGFFAPCGLTDVERSDPAFAIDYRDETKSACRHDGPSWPYSESLVLTALANALQCGKKVEGVSRADYAVLLHQYAAAHRRMLPNSKTVSWIDENRDPFTGEWLARRIFEMRNMTERLNRGKDYNHSTFCDLVLSGLCGIRPKSDGSLDVVPLMPMEWEYLRVSGLRIGERDVEVRWDRTGRHYGRGKGLVLVIDGAEKSISLEGENTKGKQK